MASEQFSLCWDNFHKNMSSGMNTLLENEDLVDVTLAVEGRCLKAHKMVLSVCSPYFKELFKSNPCQHPIVFMKDVSYVALSDLLQFMYQGEVQVSQENLSTFIKTAEALQIKGLTGDGNGTNDTESESFTERSQPEEYKPIQRPKKQPASQITPSPALHSAKRMRVNYSNESQASPSSNIITKPEPPHQSSPAAVIGGSGTSSGAVSAAAGASAPGSSSVSDMIQFKMEPYDHSQNIISVDEAGGDDTFDENLDDTNVDETEDYSMVEGNEDEPQAGTSADGAGDGQDEEVEKDEENEDNSNVTEVEFIIINRPTKRRRKRVTTRNRFISGGFVYHTNVIAGNPQVRYLGCADQRKTGCHGRAILPLGANIEELKVTKEHNHPPDETAAEKDLFLTELKKAVLSEAMEKSSLKAIYDRMADLYPSAAKEIQFRSINSSLHRWRKLALGKYDNSEDK